MKEDILSIEIEEIEKEKYEYVKKIENIYQNDRKIRFYLKIKYLLDFFVAFWIITILSPSFMIVPLIIKITSKGPVLFKQKRFGKDLKPFYIYKFRTMVKDAHEKQNEFQTLNEMNGGALFKCKKDPRITVVGKFLRKFSLDELPQLINILKGDMSIIGPRPLSTPINIYEPYQLKRFIVKPGLGCIWQAYFRNENDFTRWIRTDLIYLKKASLLFDMKLLIRIFINVIKGKGAR